MIKSASTYVMIHNSLPLNPKTALMDAAVVVYSHPPLIGSSPATEEQIERQGARGCRKGMEGGVQNYGVDPHP